MARIALCGARSNNGDSVPIEIEGYLADALLVEGDPAKDVTILQDAGKLTAIMKDGAFCKAPGTGQEHGVQAAE